MTPPTMMAPGGLVAGPERTDWLALMPIVPPLTPGDFLARLYRWKTLWASEQIPVEDALRLAATLLQAWADRDRWELQAAQDAAKLGPQSEASGRFYLALEIIRRSKGDTLVDWALETADQKTRAAEAKHL